MADDATSDADEGPGAIEEDTDMEVCRLREKILFNNRDYNTNTS